MADLFHAKRHARSKKQIGSTFQSLEVAASARKGVVGECQDKEGTREQGQRWWWGTAGEGVDASRQDAISERPMAAEPLILKLLPSLELTQLEPTSFQRLCPLSSSSIDDCPLSSSSCHPIRCQQLPAALSIEAA